MPRHAVSTPQQAAQARCDSRGDAAHAMGGSAITQPPAPQRVYTASPTRGQYMLPTRNMQQNCNI